MQLRSSIIGDYHHSEARERNSATHTLAFDTRNEEHLNRDDDNDNQSVSGIQMTRGGTTFSGQTGRFTLGKFRGRVPQSGGIGTGKSSKKSIIQMGDVRLESGYEILQVNIAFR